MCDGRNTTTRTGRPGKKDSNAGYVALLPSIRPAWFETTQFFNTFQLFNVSMLATNHKRKDHRCDDFPPFFLLPPHTARAHDTAARGPLNALACSPRTYPREREPVRWSRNLRFRSRLRLSSELFKCVF